MTDVLVYCPDYRKDARKEEECQWHSNHRVFEDLRPGDRLWVVTSGKSLGLENESAGYVVAVWPVAQVIKNPGDDPQYPARKFEHRVLVNEIEAIQLELCQVIVIAKGDAAIRENTVELGIRESLSQRGIKADIQIG